MSKLFDYTYIVNANVRSVYTIIINIMIAYVKQKEACLTLAIFENI